MLDINELSDLSDAELDELVKNVEKVKHKRAQQQVKDLQKQAADLAAALGVTPEELLKGVKKAPRKTVAPKYRNPENAEQTWSGRGNRPAWVVAALEAGKSLDDLAI